MKILLMYMMQLAHHINYSIFEGLFYYQLCIFNGPNILYIIIYGLFSLMFKWLIFPGYKNMSMLDFKLLTIDLPFFFQLMVCNVFLLFFDLIIITNLDLNVYLSPSFVGPETVFSSLELFDEQGNLINEEKINLQKQKLNNHYNNYFYACVCFGIFLWVINSPCEFSF
jgi:hypothetical protein